VAGGSAIRYTVTSLSHGGQNVAASRLKSDGQSLSATEWLTALAGWVAQSGTLAMTLSSDVVTMTDQARVSDYHWISLVSQSHTAPGGDPPASCLVKLVRHHGGWQ
jgi:hypothetical protein